MREFVRGAAMLGRGFALWRTRPGLMALGLVPAAIVGAVFLAGLVTLGAFLPAITEALTPFADGWPGVWATVIRVTVGTAVFAAALVLVAVSFTALTLVVGDPFYERIWRAIEADAGAPVTEAPYGFWRSAADGLWLVVRGAGVALAATLLALIPAVGAIVSTIFAVTFTGWLLADELTSRALSARGMPARDRRALMRTHRARMLGFGVATQLCFMVPLGAVVTMPAAVAGATLLGRETAPAPPPSAIPAQPTGERAP